MKKDNKGLLDHLTDVEEVGSEMSAVLELINDETVKVGEKINKHNARINQLKGTGRAAKAGDYKKVTLLAASDINTFSKRVEGVLPDFEKAVRKKAIRKLDAAYTGYVLLANPSSHDDVELVHTILKSLPELLEVIRQAKESMSGFRDSGLELGAMNISKDLTAAAKRQATAIDRVIRNTEEVESFALRLNFQINEKFGDIFGD